MAALAADTADGIDYADGSTPTFQSVPRPGLLQGIRRASSRDSSGSGVPFGVGFRRRMTPRTLPGAAREGVDGNVAYVLALQ